MNYGSIDREGLIINMKKYNERVDSIIKGLKKPKTEDELAKKHSEELNMPLNKAKKILKKQIEKGEKVEQEHTTSKKVANVIARHHEEEKLNYYDALAKSKL